MPDQNGTSRLEKAARDLQDAMTIMAQLEKRQSEMLREHSERIVAPEERSAIFQQRTNQNLAEITDKLNGLIGYVSGQQQPPKN
jgi:apolipoprotein N-acyltransferase